MKYGTILGKEHLGRGFLLLTVAIALPAMVSGARAAGGEEAWLLLEQGRTAEALATADGTDPISRWVAAQAHHEQDPQFTATDGVGQAAVLFATRSYAEAAGRLESLPESAQDLYLRLRLAACKVEMGLIPEAEQMLDAAIAEARERGRRVSECYGLLTRGRARVRLRQVEPPRQDLKAALDMALELDARKWAGSAAIALSVISRLQMDLEDALHWRREALEHYRAAGNLRGQAVAQHYIAAIQIMQGDLTRAMTGLQDARALAERDGDPSVLGGILGEMAAVNYHLGDFDRALDQYREAVRLAGHPWQRGMMLVNIGSIHEFRHRAQEAVPVLQEALELMRQVGDHRTETQALQSLGEAYIELGRLDEGLAALDEAIAAAREFEIPMSEASALEIKGQGLRKRGDLVGARLAFDAAIARARAIDYFDSLEWALLGRAQVARAEGQPLQALEDLREALAEVAEVRRRSGGAASVTSGITGQAGGITGELIDLLYDLHLTHPEAGYAAQAYAVAQEARERAFLDLMTEADYDLQISAVPGFREQEGAILKRIVGLEKSLSTAPADSAGSLRARLAAAENDLEMLEARLRAEDPRYAQILYPEPLGLEEVRREVLRPGELLLEYRLGEERSFLWVVDRSGARMLALPGRAAIEKAVRDLLPFLRDYNLTGPEAAWYVPPARALHTLLLESVAADIETADQLIICADGILHYLPFEVLLTRDTAAASFADLPWLVRDKVVRYTPSASILGRLGREDPVSGEDWLLVGDPVLVAGEDAGLFARAAGAAGLPPLPWAGREIQTLAGLAPGRARVLTAGQATRRGLAEAGRRGGLSLVHIASHGLFNEARPRYSGLVLSPDPERGDDGFLSVPEILALDLNCRQVVLSACASALGPHVTGEGLVGLTRSFHFAGARSVISALWDVSGEPTARFMEVYYGDLAGGSRDRAAALARAKRKFWMRSFEGVDPAHPALWGAFVLSGVGR